MPRILSHRIKLYPSQEAEVYLLKSCGTARFAYNWALRKSIDTWREAKKSLSGFDLVKVFNSIKAIEFPWTAEVSKWAPQKAIQNLGDAFKGFFRKRTRFPRFKKKGQARDSFYLGDKGFSVLGRRLRLPKLENPIRMAQEVRFPGEVKAVVISREANEWFASFQVEVDDSWVYPHRCESQAVVGIDLGIKTLATLSDGTSVENPKALGRHSRKLRRAQRSLSRKIKGSRNRAKARMALARVHRKVARIRNDTIHKATARIVREFRWIGIEDLNVAGMVRNHKLARSLSDAAFGEFRRQLGYKSVLSGSVVAAADRFFPSSKTCSVCGRVLDKLPLSVRDWTCPCVACHDRDRNASVNLELVARRHRDTQNACGDGVRPIDFFTEVERQPSMKQESAAGL